MVIEQSAVVPYLVELGKLHVVLVTSSSRNGWVIPKGIIEDDMTPQESAMREAWEEAGITGAISDGVIAEYSYKKWGSVCRVQVFPMEVDEILETWEEADFRARTIVPVQEAIRMAKPRLTDSLNAFFEKFRGLER